jgi:hypothetical protein
MEINKMKNVGKKKMTKDKERERKSRFSFCGI